MKLGEGIRLNRFKLNLTQDDLADQLFVSRQTISKWEQGNTYPDLSNLIRLAEIFEVSIDELVTGDKFIKKPFVIGIKPNRKIFLKKFFCNQFVFLTMSSTLFLALGIWSIFFNNSVTFASTFAYRVPINITVGLLLSFAIFTLYSNKIYPYWMITDEGIYYMGPLTYQQSWKRNLNLLFHDTDEVFLSVIPYHDIESGIITYEPRAYQDKDIIAIPQAYNNPTVAMYYIMQAPLYIALKTKDTVINLDLKIDYYRGDQALFHYNIEVLRYLNNRNIKISDPDNIIQRVLSGEDLS